MKLGRSSSCLSPPNSVFSALRQNPVLHTPVNLYMAVLQSMPTLSSHVCLLSRWLCAATGPMCLPPTGFCFHLYSICSQRQEIVCQLTGQKRLLHAAGTARSRLVLFLSSQQ